MREKIGGAAHSSLQVAEAACCHQLPVHAGPPTWLPSSHLVYQPTGSGANAAAGAQRSPASF